MQAKDIDDLSEPKGNKEENFQKRHPPLPPWKNCRLKCSKLISEEMLETHQKNEHV